MGSSPIRYQHPIESPFGLQHHIVEETVLGTIVAVDLVVRVHDGTHFRNSHSRFKRWQVNLSQCPFRHDHIDVLPINFLIVGSEMFDGRGDALALNPSDERHNKLRSQIRILAGDILKIPATNRQAINVYPGSEQNVDASGPTVPGDGYPFPLSEIPVPTGRQRDPGRIASTRFILSDAQRAVGHPDLRKTKPGNWPNGHRVDSADVIELLFQRHLSQKFLHSL